MMKALGRGSRGRVVCRKGALRSGKLQEEEGRSENQEEEMHENEKPQ